MLASIASFKPTETIFEVGRGGKTSNTESVEVMKMFRKKAGPRRDRKKMRVEEDDIVDDDEGEDKAEGLDESDDDEFEVEPPAGEYDGSDSESDLEVTITNKQPRSSTFADPEIFMNYKPRNDTTAEDRAYGVHSGSASFMQEANQMTMDLGTDETAKNFGVAARRGIMRWDKKAKNYVSRVNDVDGSRGEKTVVGESGVRIAASFSAGRFDRWKKKQRIAEMPRNGEAERTGGGGGGGGGGGAGGPRYRHTQEKAPKEADKFRDDYQVKKKRVNEARENRVGRFKDGGGRKNELKDGAGVKKDRIEKEKKREKTGRHDSKGGKIKGGGRK